MNEFLLLPAFGKLYFHHIYAFYDEPLVFSCVSNAQQYFFVTAIPSSENSERWLIVPVSTGRLLTAERNKIEVRNLLLDPETTVLMISRNESDVSVEVVNPDALGDDLLPTKGVFLDYNGYSELVASEVVVLNQSATEKKNIIEFPLEKDEQRATFINSYLMKNLVGITATSIEKYLLFTGWSKDETFRNPNVWMYFKTSDPELRLAVPSSETLKDFYPSVYRVIQTLAILDNRSEPEIINSIKSAYSDRMQFRIILDESKNGEIPLEYAAQCINGLKDLVLYSACAEEKAKPICNKSYNSAKKYLDNFRFCQTQVGSFIINIDVPVVDESKEQFYMLEVTNPPADLPEHKIIKRIEKAISQVDSVANGSVHVADLIKDGYEEGITANMCDALSRLKPEKSEDVRVETSIYYAEAITHAVEPPKVCSINYNHFMFIEEISKRYKDCTLIEDVTLEGKIKMLLKNSTDDEDENTVSLLTEIDNKERSIMLHLSPRDHTAACNAYRDDKEVQVSGTLDKSRRRWFFSDVISFNVID